MGRHFTTKSRKAWWFTSRANGRTILAGCALTGIALLWSEPAVTQSAVSSNMQPSLGLGAASPLSSNQRTSIPLGAAELATPGIAPVVPSQSVTAGTCTDYGNSRSSSALFDGGGLSGSSSPSCSDAKNAASSASSAASVGRVGIPLGTTELGNAGVSPLSPTPQ